MTTSLTKNSTLELRRLKAEKLRRLHRKNPEAYARQTLQVDWWHKQAEIARALVEHKRVFVKAGNGPGKTFLAGGLVNWFYDLYPRGICLTTAPTGQQVKDVLWKEIRIQRNGRPGLQPKAPRMETGPEHFAIGYTAESQGAFQGRHAEHLFIVFDEATDIDGDFWDAANGMQPLYWLVLLNPVSTASRAYEEEQKDGWHVITLNAFEHPNIVSEMAGEPPPYPQSSLRLDWVRERVKEWCTRIEPTDRKAADFDFEGHCYRPGPLFEARVLGRWPTAGSTSVWNEACWQAALTHKPIPDAPLEAGCDVARFGDDFTSIILGRGACALHHETHNGWDTGQTAGRLKHLVKQFCQEGEDPEKVRIKIDDDGVGGGVYDQREEFTFVPINAGGKPLEPLEYPNARSEMWFSVVEQGNDGLLDLSRLSSESLQMLRRQAMAPTWKMDSQSRRVVEPKSDTKKRIGRSPDDMDALNLWRYGGGKRIIKWG